MSWLQQVSKYKSSSKVKGGWLAGAHGCCWHYKLSVSVCLSLLQPDSCFEPACSGGAAMYPGTAAIIIAERIVGIMTDYRGSRIVLNFKSHCPIFQVGFEHGFWNIKVVYHRDLNVTSLPIDRSRAENKFERVNLIWLCITHSLSPRHLYKWHVRGSRIPWARRDFDPRLRMCARVSVNRGAVLGAPLWQ